MRLHRAIAYHPLWNDPDLPDPDRREMRKMESLVDLRAHSKRLQDCALPDGFRLITVQPKQFWIDQQLVWGFALGWAPVDIQGRRWCEDRWSFVARYDWRIADEVQINWAVAEFARELEVAGVVGEVKRKRAA